MTLVRTANSPRLLFLGGELVGGETPWWRDARIPFAVAVAAAAVHRSIPLLTTFKKLIQTKEANFLRLETLNVSPSRFDSTQSI